MSPGVPRASQSLPGPPKNPLPKMLPKTCESGTFWSWTTRGPFQGLPQPPKASQPGASQSLPKLAKAKASQVARGSHPLALPPMSLPEVPGASHNVSESSKKYNSWGVQPKGPPGRRQSPKNYLINVNFPKCLSLFPVLSPSSRLPFHQKKNPKP